MVLLGKGPLALRIVDWFLGRPEWTLSFVVPDLREPEWMESLVEYARAKRVRVVESGDYRDIPPDEVIDLAVSSGYSTVLGSDFLSRCGRAVNIHNAPLPRYRGIRPINWALKNGEYMHGVTIHEMTSTIDGGPIVAQTLFSIYPDIDEVRDVYYRAVEYGWLLFQHTMPVLDRISPRAQDAASATYYSARDAQQLGDRRGLTRFVGV